MTVNDAPGEPGSWQRCACGKLKQRSVKILMMLLVQTILGNSMAVMMEGNAVIVLVAGSGATYADGGSNDGEKRIL